MRTLKTCLVYLTALLATAVFSAGCSVSSKMMTHLSDTIVNNNDLAMVEDGAPAYLLMIDSLISEDPDSEEMLTTAALLYTAYSDVFVKEKVRSRKLAAKALKYGSRAMCEAESDACGMKDMPYEEFKAVLADLDKGEVPPLFALGSAWAGWIMANRDDFNALADISRIEDIMARVTALDETFRDGAAYMYLATLSTFLPPALGGKPEQGKAYFEKAIVLSQGKNLMAKVMYAKLYARMIFDRDLHDRLLKEVMDTNPEVDGYTLVNTYAQQQARQLLDDADDYF